MTNMQRRLYQTKSGKMYQTGVERMIQDKFNFTKMLGKIPWFAVLGGLNLGAYGLSLLMSEEDYLNMFAYKGNFDSRMSNLPRAMIGSNNIYNAAVTSAMLIGLGTYMHLKLGAMTMAKFTAMALFGVAMSW